MLRKHLILAALMGALLVPALASAAVPTTMTQQGRLLNSDGTPVTGSKSIRFALYDAANGGATLWEDSLDVTFDETGFYTAVLGGGSNPLDAMVFGDGVAYLTMAVDGGEEMSPRHPVTSVPYAQIAGGVVPGSITEEALDPNFMLGADNITDVNWAALQNVPAGLSDGDDDALGGITCNLGQVVGYGTSGWECVDVLTNQTTTLSSLNCAVNQVAGYNGSTWVCLDWVAPSSTIGAYNCANGQVLKSTGAGWSCQTDNNTTYSAGIGLSLNGTTFSFNNGYTVPNATQAANAGTLDNLDSLEFFRLASANTASNTNTFNGTTNLNGPTNIGATATTTAKRVYRDKAGNNGVTGSESTYTTSLNRLHLRNDRRGETLQIPQADLVALCGDEDGCTMKVSMRSWNSAGTSQIHANSRGVFHFQYNNANGAYRAQDSVGYIGVDGDGAMLNTDMGYTCCYLSDFQYVSSVGQGDSAKSMYLLNWTTGTTGTCPAAENMECHLTIDD